MARWWIVLGLGLVLLGCKETPTPGDDDDDDDVADDDDTGDDDTGDDDTADDDDVTPDIPGNCYGQPDHPAPSTIASPQPRLSFGTNGGYRGSPQVMDWDNDGQLEILASEFDRVTVYEIDGTEIWSGPISGRNFSGVVLADLDGQGEPEVIAGDNQGNVHAWAAGGAIVQGWPVQVNMGADVRSLAAADIDDDGDDEVIVYSSLTDQGTQANMYIYDGDGVVTPGWPHYVQGDPATNHACDWCGGFNQNIAVGDVDDDDTLDVVFTQDRYSVSVFDILGEPRPVHTSFDWCSEGEDLRWGDVRSYLPHDSEFSAVCNDGVDEILEFTYSPPLIADLDHDGTAEIITVPNRESVDDIGPILGSVLAVYEPDRRHRTGFAPYEESDADIYTTEGSWHEVNPVAVAANLQGDADLEIAAVHLDGTIRLYSAAGHELWDWDWADGNDCLATEPLIADLDGDKVPEILLVASCPNTGTSTMTVIGGDGYDRNTTNLPFPTIAAPLLVDLEGDGDLEVVFSSEGWTPSIYIYDWPGADDSCLIWPQGRGNPGHTGSLQ